MLTPLSYRSITSWLLHVETVIVQAQHYDVIDVGIIARSKRLARRVPVDISLAQKKRENMATEKLVFIKTAVATIFILTD